MSHTTQNEDSDHVHSHPFNMCRLKPVIWGLTVGLIFMLLLVVCANVVLGASNPWTTWNRSSPSAPTLHLVYGLWDKTPLPDTYRATLESWQAKGWQVKLWNAMECHELAQKHHALGGALWSRLQRPVQRADLSRLLILYEHGGMYADFDVEERPKKSLLTLWQEEAKDLFFIEHIMPKHWPAEAARRFPIRQGKPEHRERLSNFLMGAAEPKSPAIHAILTELVKRCQEHPQIREDYDVLYTTGPDCLTEVIQDYRTQHPDKVRIVDHRDYARHRCDGGWRSNQDVRSVSTQERVSTQGRVATQEHVAMQGRVATHNRSATTQGRGATQNRSVTTQGRSRSTQTAAKDAVY